MIKFRETILIVIAIVAVTFMISVIRIPSFVMPITGYGNTSTSRMKNTPPKRPFPMPEVGTAYSLFQPLYDLKAVAETTRASTLSFIDEGAYFVGPAKVVIQVLQRRLEWLDTFFPDAQSDGSALERACLAYLQVIRQCVSGLVYKSSERSVDPAAFQLSSGHLNPLDTGRRQGGTDWTYLGDTMTGQTRLENVQNLLTDVIEKKITGDYIETGVWRGGSSMLARAVLVAYDQPHRKSFVCDSFRGLPPMNRNLDPSDKGWDQMKYLEVAAETVAEGFAKYSLLDENVIFAKGFFNETMPALAKHVTRFAVMRLDGDMYESTVDVLYHLYDKLSIGGYLIMDDWYGFPSKTACEHFFSVHGISPEIIQIDALSAYWKKTEQVDIQYWRYQQNKFKP
jgi:O-methyltransferase